MQKLTLHFGSLSDLASFSKLFNGGFLLNTNNLTLTGKIPEQMVSLALELYKARLIELSEKVYSYEPLN